MMKLIIIYIDGEVGTYNHLNGNIIIRELQIKEVILCNYIYRKEFPRKKYNFPIK